MPSTDLVSDPGSSTESTVLLTIDAGVATVALNRPKRLNAINTQLLADLLRTLEQVASDDSVRVVILTGSGKGFCSGGDLSEGPGALIGGPDLSPQERIGVMRRFMETSRLLHTMPQVTIAAVNGACAGAGLSWACACDIRIASHAAAFKTAFLSAGLPGDFGGTWTLSRVTGPAKARELYLLNDRIGGEEALRIGLVSKLVDPKELLPEALRLAERLVAAPHLAITAMKDNLNDAETVSFAEGLDLEIRRHVFGMGTRDAAEASTAFIEKREPVFVGE